MSERAECWDRDGENKCPWLQPRAVLSQKGKYMLKCDADFQLGISLSNRTREGFR